MKNFAAILFIFTLALGVISCNSKSEDTKKESTQSLDSTGTITPKATNTQPPINLTTTPQTGNVTPAGINPPHGEPGHDCKVAVGSPLNSAPKNTSTTQPGPVNPGIQTSPRVNATTVTPPGMNPPHGQPGHDCKIQVGKPLDGSQ